jgi:hypothetical protein
MPMGKFCQLELKETKVKQWRRKWRLQPLPM